MTKIDLYWDLRLTLPDHHTGVGKHVIEVFNGLIADPGFDLRVLVAADQISLWRVQSAHYRWTNIPSVRLPYANKVLRVFYGLSLFPALDRICEGRDLVYSPTEHLLGLSKIPFVNTVHGIPCFEKTIPREVYSSRLYRQERVKQGWFLRRSRRLCHKTFVVSDYLKNRLQEQFAFKESELHVVYNGADNLFFEEVTASEVIIPNSDSPRLLCVGGANVFDGAPAILSVSRILQARWPEVRIRVVGDRHESPWYELLKKQPNVEWLGFLRSTELCREMHTATGLLYLPTVESFGIIGVEAMACGLPIIASKGTSLPEILGDCAWWIDPEEEECVMDAVKSISTDSDGCRKRVQSGRERAEKFRWSNTIEKVISGIREVSKK